MVLSYVLIGAAVSPIIYANRVVPTLVAYFLGLGFSAHALNELHARHWGDALSKSELTILFVAPLIGAMVIGAYGMVVLYAASGALLAPLVLLAFIALETLFPVCVQYGPCWWKIPQRPIIRFLVGRSANSNKLLCERFGDYSRRGSRSVGNGCNGRYRNQPLALVQRFQT